MLCGVDLGGTKVVFALVSPEGKVVARQEVRGHQAMTPDATVAMIASEITGLLDRSGVSRDAIEGIGVGTCGHVNHSQGIVITNSQLTSFVNYPLGERLIAATGMTVRVDNDANAQAYAEYQFGNAQGFDTAAFVTVSTGIGAGFVMGGKLFRGAMGTAGEIGHTIVNPFSTIRCGCGNFGCLMAHASGQALPQIVRQKLLVPGAQTTIDFATISDAEITGELIARGFEAGDPLCTAIVMEYADYLGIGLYNLFQTLDPEVIVVGGGLTNWGTRYIDRVRDRFYRTAGRMLSHDLEIRPALLDADAAVVGAAALVMEPQ